VVPAFTPPPTPPGADPEAVLLVSSICAAAHQGPQVGCRSHPPFVRAEQQPDGKLPEYTGDVLRFCRLLKIYRGAFTRPHAKQAVLAFEQCVRDDVDWDMGQPGSAVLVEETNGRWRAVATQNDVNIEHCLLPRRDDGRELLFCWSNLTAAPPVGTINYWFSLDFGKPPPFASTHAQLFSSSKLCWGLSQPSTLAAEGFIAVQLLGTTLSDAPSPRLQVRVARARVPASPDLKAKAQAACKKNPEADEQAFGASKQEATLEFELASGGVRALPTTATLLEAWTRESPENFYGLTGASPPMALP
jgi:hypothetical protein